MDILVTGASGHMGKILCDMIREDKNGHFLAGMIANHKEGDILSSFDDFKGKADCIIDFSFHEGTKALVDYAVKENIPLVIATTGQSNEEMEMIKEASSKIPLFFSGNMSMGVALLKKMGQMAAKLFPDADIEIVEQHHNRKVDVPSGTALLLGNAIREVRPESFLLTGRHENGKRKKEEIGIHSLRTGNTVGMHEIIINTGTQSLTLKHEAFDRALFAEGSLTAADFIVTKKPGLYGIDDLTEEE